MSEEIEKHGRSGWFNKGTALGLFLGLSLALFVSLFLFAKKPDSALTAGLLGDSWDELSAKFDSRVKRQFPVGSETREMMRVLSRQGFRPDWQGELADEFLAIRSESDFVCNISAEIYWRTTGDGRIRAIRGRYLERGCL